jgi:hypothetical protein
MKISRGRPPERAGAPPSLDPLEASADMSAALASAASLESPSLAGPSLAGPSLAGPSKGLSATAPSKLTALESLASAKDSARRRKSEKISRENLLILKRLNAVKPEYSAAALARQRRREKTVLRLRATDHTAGHIQPGAAPTRKSRMYRELSTSSFLAAAQLSLTTPVLLASKGATTQPNTGTLGSGTGSPRIYVDPAVLQFLPSAAPASRKTARPKGRQRSPEPKEGRRSPEPGFARAGAKGRARRASPSPERSQAGTPAPDDASVSSSMSQSMQTVFSGTKTFSVFGIDKTKTSDCVVEVLMREPWDGSLSIRVVSKTEGLLASKKLGLDAAKKLEAYNSSHQQGAQDILELHELLTSLFMEADVTKSGELKYEEFIRCMEKADLGISAPELRLVMAEADDNDDGVIDYEE